MCMSSSKQVVEWLLFNSSDYFNLRQFFNLCPHSYIKEGSFLSSIIISLHKPSWKYKFPIPRNIVSHRFSLHYNCCFALAREVFLFLLPTLSHHNPFILTRSHYVAQVVLKDVYNPPASAYLVLESQMYANILDKMVFHSSCARFQPRSLHRPGWWMTTGPLLQPHFPHTDIADVLHEQLNICLGCSLPSNKYLHLLWKGRKMKSSLFSLLTMYKNSNHEPVVSCEL